MLLEAIRNQQQGKSTTRKIVEASVFLDKLLAPSFGRSCRQEGVNLLALWLFGFELIASVERCVTLTLDLLGTSRE